MVSYWVEENSGKRTLASLTWALMICILVSLDSFNQTEAGILDWQASGWVEWSFYPPHNEFDPNPGVIFSDRAVARYGFEAYIEVRPKDFNRLFLHSQPLVLFGDSRPQLDYNYSTKPLALNAKWGIGYCFFKNKDIQIKITHSEWMNLGGYKGERLVWNAIQIRYNFGTR